MHGNSKTREEKKLQGEDEMDFFDPPPYPHPHPPPLPFDPGADNRQIWAADRFLIVSLPGQKR